MIKKIIFLITFVILSSCKGPEKISEEEVLTAFDNFFDVLDNDLDNFSAVVTDDFLSLKIAVDIIKKSLLIL